MSEHGSQAQDSSFDEEDDAAAEALDVMVRGQSTELCENCQSCEKCRHLEIFPVPRTPGMAQSPAEGPLGTSSLGSSTGSFPSGGIEGRISKPHRLPPTAMGEQGKLERRRRRIPDDATHVVFAYQLKPWTTNDLQDTEQLAVFQMCARTLRPPHT